jgi:hypothetical protein
MNSAALANPDDGIPPKQVELLAPDELAHEVFFERLERTTGDYTAERLRSKRPDDYKVIMALLARGYGSQKIQDEFHRLGKKLSKNTVKAVRAVEGESLDLLRTRLAGEAFVAADDYRAAAILLLDEIMADPKRRKKLTVRDVQSLEVASGIATQNAQLLAGLPTARLELSDLREPDHDDFNRQLARLPAIDPVSTHLGEKTPGQKDAPAGAAADDATTATITAPGNASTDSESAGNITEP